MLDDMPAGLRDRLDGYHWDRQTIGASDAGVFRLTAPAGPSLFLKVEQAAPLAELPDELARLEWLASQPFACPRVLAFETERNRHWLLMSAVPGGDLVSSPLPPDMTVELIAGALRRLHALDVAACPFDHRLEYRLQAARARMEAGLVDVDDFDDERSGRTPQDLFAELLAQKPASEDLVVTHGDACMPNVMADGGRFSGFIDCARLGVADWHQDVALACWSIQHNLGVEWVAPFLAHYGMPADTLKLDYYGLLDEFF